MFNVSKVKRSAIRWYKNCFEGNAFAIGLMWLLLKRQETDKIAKKRFPDMSYWGRLRLRLGMARAYGNLGFDYTEYLGYELYEKDFKDWASFVSDGEHNKFVEKYNGEKRVFDDKLLTYERLRPFYNRKVVVIANTSEFLEFATTHNEFIVKPRCGSLGRGVFVYRNGGSESLADLIKESRDGLLLAEELLVSCVELSKIHPASLNTVRVPTFMVAGNIEVVCPFFRCGRDGSCVDNAGAGGIVCAINEKTGVVLNTSDEVGRRYEEHPNTKIKLIGFQIPRWSELLNLAKEVHSLFPSNAYCAWDFALTDKGWTLIEGNYAGQFIWQFALKIGFRERLNEILKSFEQLETVEKDGR